MKNNAIKIAVVYFIIGFLWIFLSDIFLVKVSYDNNEPLYAHLIKGILYVLITSVLLFYLIRRYTKSLRESGLQYKRLFIENPNPRWIYDVNSLKILEVNNAAVKKYGFSREEFLSMTILELQPKEKVKELKEILARPGSRYRESGIWQHKKKNGELFYVKVFSHSTLFNKRKARLVLALDVHEKYLADQKVLRLTQKLRERKAYLSSLIDSQSNYLVRVDMQGRYTFVNKAFCQKLGYDRKSLIGQSYVNTISPEDLEKCQKIVEECISHPGKVVSLEARKTDVNGSIFMMSWEFVGVPDTSGQTVEIQGVGQDVTQRYEFYKQLTETKERLENILSTVNDVVWSCRADDLSVLYINPACENVCGYPQEAYYRDNQLWFDNILPEDRSQVKEALSQLFSTGEREAEYRVRHKDGTIRYVYNKAILIKNHSSGYPVINGVASDITPIKIAEKQAQENARLKEEILESITDGFFALDRSWNITYINKECERMLNVKREDLLGRGLWEHFPEAVNLKFYTEYHRAMQDNISVKFEEYYPPLKAWVKASAYPTKDGLAIYFQDITQEKILKMEVEKSEENLSALINNTQDLIWLVDSDLKILSANQSFYKTVKKGTGRSIHKGDEILQCIKEEKQREKWNTYYQRALQGRYQIVEHEVSADGEKYIETNFNPIISGKKVIGVGCVARDITKNRKNEAKIRLQNQILREIARIQSHDLRRPLATIMGLVVLFDKENPASEFNAEIIDKMGLVCAELDDIIHKVIEKTFELEKI